MTRALRLMLRALATAMATVCVLMGIWHPPAASAVALKPTATYVYDGNHHSAPSTTSTSERGPPAAYDRYINDDAVDRRSHGGSVCSDAGTSRGDFTYNAPAMLASARCVRLRPRRP